MAAAPGRQAGAACPLQAGGHQDRVEEEDLEIHVGMCLAGTQWAARVQP